jgi:hypothetical protein
MGKHSTFGRTTANRDDPPNSVWQRKPKAVISGLMGWEAEPSEKPTAREREYFPGNNEPAFKISLTDCCPCGVPFYLRRYDHLIDGPMIRCIWCGQTWWPIQQSSFSFNEETGRKPQGVVRDLGERKKPVES